jgi:hypothetical protein
MSGTGKQRFELLLDTGNGFFRPGDDESLDVSALAAVIRAVADDVESGRLTDSGHPHGVWEPNGNRCGSVAVWE